MIKKNLVLVTISIYHIIIIIKQVLIICGEAMYHELCTETEYYAVHYIAEENPGLNL